MTIIQKLNIVLKKKYNFFSNIDLKSLRIHKFNPVFLVSFLVVFSGLFFISFNLIEQKSEKKASNLKEITETSEFSNLTNFLFSNK